MKEVAVACAIIGAAVVGLFWAFRSPFPEEYVMPVVKKPWANNLQSRHRRRAG